MISITTESTEPSALTTLCARLIGEAHHPTETQALAIRHRARTIVIDYEKIFKQN